MLLEDIKDSMFQAKKDGNKAKSSILATLYAEASIVGKNKGNRESTDPEVIQVIKKTIKINKDNIKLMKDKGKDWMSFANENEIIEKFLPQQLSKDELKIIIEGIDSLPEGKAAIGIMMKTLKSSHDGQFDPRLAQEILIEIQA